MEDIMLISLSYNPKNVMAQKTIDFVLSLGLFKKVESSCDDELCQGEASSQLDTRERAQSFAALCSQVKGCEMSEEEILSECKAARQTIYNRHYQAS